MQISIDTAIIEKLSSKGVLAYLAVVMADGTEASTASLAGLVRCQTAVMLEGLKDLSVAAPELVAKAKTKWRCGVVKSGDGVVLGCLDLQAERRKEFLDDVKAIWEWGNKGMTFTMDALDGRAVGKFLNQYREWDRQMWQKALRNRFLSEGIVRSAPLHRWLGLLVEYAEKPLDRFGKQMENGGGKRGETITIREQNREAVARAVAHS